MKTGIVSASTSRGTITSSSKVVGRYVMLMQGIYLFIYYSINSFHQFCYDMIAVSIIYLQYVFFDFY